jgi:hypothetical protein
MELLPMAERRVPFSTGRELGLSHCSTRHALIQSSQLVIMAIQPVKPPSPGPVHSPGLLAGRGS